MQLGSTQSFSCVAPGGGARQRWRRRGPGHTHHRRRTRPPRPRPDRARGRPRRRRRSPWLRARLQRSGRCRHPGRCAAFSRTGASWCHASPAATRPRRTGAGPCVPRQVQELAVPANLQTRHLQRLGPAAQGGVVRHPQLQPEQADDGADPALGLARRRAEHRAQSERCLDRQGRVERLPARGGARCRPPALDRPVREPDRQAPVLAHGRVAGGRAGGPVLLPRHMLAAVLVQLEGQGRRPGSNQGQTSCVSPSHSATGQLRATCCPALQLCSVDKFNSFLDSFKKSVTSDPWSALLFRIPRG